MLSQIILLNRREKLFLENRKRSLRKCSQSQKKFDQNYFSIMQLFIKLTDGRVKPLIIETKTNLGVFFDRLADLDRNFVKREGERIIIVNETLSQELDLNSDITKTLIELGWEKENIISIKFIKQRNSVCNQNESGAFVDNRGGLNGMGLQNYNVNFKNHVIQNRDQATFADIQNGAGLLTMPKAANMNAVGVQENMNGIFMQGTFTQSIGIHGFGNMQMYGNQYMQMYGIQPMQNMNFMHSMNYQEEMRKLITQTIKEKDERIAEMEGKIAILQDQLSSMIKLVAEKDGEIEQLKQIKEIEKKNQLSDAQIQQMKQDLQRVQDILSECSK